MAGEFIDDIPRKDEIDIQVAPDDGVALAQFFAFNTVIDVKLALGDAAQAADARAALEEQVATCRRFEWQLSRTLRGGDLWRLNQAQGAVVQVPETTWNVLSLGRHFSENSWGTFDVTMGAVTRLWNFHTGVVPEKRALAEALGHVNYQVIRLTRAEDVCFAQLEDPEATVDLGGVAKGYIADALLALLQRRGFCGAFVNLGGNVAVYGRKANGNPWNIGVRNPFGPGVLGCVCLGRGACVTSGSSERFFEYAGKRYHHILSPVTGYPVDTNLVSASVISGRAIDAEGYSTVLLALGLEQAQRFVAQHPELAAVLVTRDGEVVSAGTTGFKRLM